MRTDGARERRSGAVTRGALALQAGAAAGMIGGCAMLTLLVVYALATGRGVLEPLQWFGGLFYGAGAMEAGFSSAAWGLVIHLCVSAALGVPFAFLVGPGTDPMVAAAAGIVYALFAWLAFTFLVLPIANPIMVRAVAQVPIAWFAAHVPYGAALALANEFRVALDARERRLQHA